MRPTGRSEIPLRPRFSVGNSSHAKELPIRYRVVYLLSSNGSLTPFFPFFSSRLLERYGHDDGDGDGDGDGGGGANS